METNKNINERAMLKVGHTLQMGKYRVEALLSSGGFGNTYVVMNTQFDERWAMKEFFMKGVNERDEDQITVSVSNHDNRVFFDAQREKFKKEARRLRRLRHPNIVGVDDLFDENGTTYYVMDYIGGGSLSEQLKKKGTFTEGQVLQLLPPLLDSLEYVHSQQMWHLDLKPGNILLNDNGQPVLIDFGASKQVGLSGTHSTSTGISYTPGYAPSEQVDGSMDRIGPWTDLYALGATLYNLLTQKTPPSVSEIQEGEAEAFEFPQNISTRMRHLIVWMMSPNRRHRPQLVADVRDYLNNPDTSVENEEKEITINGDEEQITQLKPRFKQTTKQPEPTPQQKLEPDRVPLGQPQPRVKQPQNSQRRWLWIAIALLLVGCAVALFFIVRAGRYHKSLQTGSKTVTEAVTASPSPATVTDQTYTVRMGKKDEEYSYTGPVDADQQPDGIGKAIFKNGRIYEGPFVHGKLEGNDATFYIEGDVFKGEFRDNMFYRGRYTVKDDGSYFEGTFTNGQPDKGTWYDKNGNKLD